MKRLSLVVCCLAVISAIAVPSKPNAQNAIECHDWKSEEFCSTVSLVKRLSNRLAVDGLEESAPAFPLLVSISSEAASDIGFFATFHLLKTLSETHEDFFQSEDFYHWKRRFTLQLLKYQDLGGDVSRARFYLLYFYLFIEPIDSLTTSNLKPLIGREVVPPELQKIVECFVTNDLVYLPIEKVGEQQKFLTCMG